MLWYIFYTLVKLYGQVSKEELVNLFLWDAFAAGGAFALCVHGLLDTMVTKHMPTYRRYQMTAGTFYLNKQNHTITTLKAMFQGNYLRSRTCKRKSLKDTTWSIFKNLTKTQHLRINVVFFFCFFFFYFFLFFCWF